MIEEGRFVLNNDQTGYAKDEFFSEMRQQSIEHVGQVQTAILETNGAVSFFFYPHDESKPGLPMLPKVFHQRTKQVAHDGLFACAPCAQVQYLGRGRQAGRQAGMLAMPPGRVGGNHRVETPGLITPGRGRHCHGVRATASLQAGGRAHSGCRDMTGRLRTLPVGSPGITLPATGQVPQQRI